MSDDVGPSAGRRARQWVASASACSVLFILARLAGLDPPSLLGELAILLSVTAAGAWALLHRGSPVIAAAGLYGLGVALWLANPIAMFDLQLPAAVIDALPPLTFGALIAGLGGVVIGASRGPSSPPWLQPLAWAVVAIHLADLVWFLMGRGSLMGLWAQLMLHVAVVVVMLAGRDCVRATSAAPASSAVPSVPWRVVGLGARIFRASILLQVALMAGLLIVSIGAAAGPQLAVAPKLGSLAVPVAIIAHVVIAGVATCGLWMVALLPPPAGTQRPARLAWSASWFALCLTVVIGLFAVSALRADDTAQLATISQTLSRGLALPTAVASGLMAAGFVLSVGRLGRVIGQPRLTQLVRPTLTVTALAESLYVVGNTGATAPSMGLNLVIIAANVTLFVLLLRVSQQLVNAARDMELAETFGG